MCYPPRIYRIRPKGDSPRTAKDIPRAQSFYVSARVELICAGSPSLTTHIEWEVAKLHSSGLWIPQSVSSNMTRTRNLFIPGRSLDYGTYRFNLTIQMALFPMMISSRATYVNITYSNVTANLVKFGTSIVTNAFDKFLVFDPGKYSVDFDEEHLRPGVSHSPWAFRRFVQALCVTLGLDLCIFMPTVQHDYR